MSDTYESVNRIKYEVRDAVIKASKQPYMFNGQHPITQLATGYEAGMRALCELKSIYETVNDLRNVLNVMISMHDEGLAVSPAWPSLGVILDRLPKWEGSPVDSIIDDCSMRVMNSRKYDKLINISIENR